MKKIKSFLLTLMLLVLSITITVLVLILLYYEFKYFAKITYRWYDVILFPFYLIFYFANIFNLFLYAIFCGLWKALYERVYGNSNKSSIYQESYTRSNVEFEDDNWDSLDDRYGYTDPGIDDPGIIDEIDNYDD